MRSKTSAAPFLASLILLVLGSLAVQAKSTETSVLSLPPEAALCFPTRGR